MYYHTHHELAVRTSTCDVAGQTSGQDRTYSLPPNVRQSRGDDHDDDKAKQPVTGAGDSIGLRSASQRRNLSTVEERPADPGKTKEGIKEKEESRSHKLTRPISGTSQPGNDGEADGHAGRGDDEGPTATETLDKQHREERAQSVLETAHGGDEVRHAWRQIEGLLEDLVGVGGDHVDARELLGGLEEGADGDAVESLGGAVVEELLVGEDGHLGLGFVRGNDGVALGEEEWVVGGETAEFGEVVSSLDYCSAWILCGM